MAVDKDDLNTILSTLKTKNFSKALDLIEETLPSHKEDEILNLLHCYVLTELDLTEKALNILFNIIEILNSGKFIYFSNIIFKNLDLIQNYIDISTRFPTNNKFRYEAYLLNNNYENAMTIGKMLHDESLNYDFFATVCYNLKGNTDHYYLCLVSKMIQLHFGLDHNILYFLIKKKLLQDKDILKFFGKIRDHRNVIYFLILKEMLLRKILSNNMMSRIAPKIKVYQNLNGVNAFVNYLMDGIDDWKLYEYSIENNLIVLPRKSVNYEFYLLKKNKSVSLAINLIKKTNSLAKLEEILEIIDINELKTEINDKDDEEMQFILNCITEDGKKEDIYTDCIKYFLKKSTERNLKLLLNLLIQSKQESKLLISFYIVSTEKECITQDIKLIKMYLSRFFLKINDILTGFLDTRIKNVLLNKLSYVWSDIYAINKGKYLKFDDIFECMIEMYKKDLMHNIKTINNSVLQFIEKSLFEHAFDLMELKDEIKDCIVIKEIENMEILTNSCEEKKFEGLNLLGKKANWLFEKISIERFSRNKKIFGDFKVLNAYNFCGKRDPLFFDDPLYELFGNEIVLFIKCLVSIQKDHIK